MCLGVGVKMIVRGEGGGVGVKGGLVDRVELGGKCVGGSECEGWNEIKGGIRGE